MRYIVPCVLSLFSLIEQPPAGNILSEFGHEIPKSLLATNQSNEYRSPPPQPQKPPPCSSISSDFISLPGNPTVFSAIFRTALFALTGTDFFLRMFYMWPAVSMTILE
jgi:hypothetical protein